MPENGAATHEDALQPPSQIPPSDASVGGSSAAAGATSRTGKIKAMFKRTNENSYREAELARAAAEAGHMPFPPTPTGGSVSLATQQMQQQQYQYQQTQQKGYPQRQFPDQQQHLQQQQQQYYDPNMAPPQKQQQPSYFASNSHPQQQYAVDASTPLQGGDPPVVGVMYATEGHRTMASAAAASAANSLRSGGKAVRNSGRALFNSMKNLSLVRSGSNLKPTKDESEWESKWDDDEDSDSDNDHGDGHIRSLGLDYEEKLWGRCGLDVGRC